MCEGLEHRHWRCRRQWSGSGNADLTQRIPSATNDEIGDVVNGFNGFIGKLHSIVTNLQNSQEQLSKIDGNLQDSTENASESITQIISNIENVNSQISSVALLMISSD